MAECKACGRSYDRNDGAGPMCGRHPCPVQEELAEWRRRHTGRHLGTTSTASTTSTIAAATPLKLVEKNSSKVGVERSGRVERDPVQCDNCWRTWHPADGDLPVCSHHACPLRAAYAGAHKDEDFKEQKRKKRYIEIAPGSREWDAYRQTAIQLIKNKLSYIKEITHGTHMTCVMLYAKGAGKLGILVAYSGFLKDKRNLKDFRTQYEISTTKATICAEEHMLIRHPNIPFLFSISYNHAHKVCRACTYGCETLLKAKGIEDLADYIHC